MTEQEIKDQFRRAVAAFDCITGASYYGLAFKSVLARDPEALAAAEKLADSLWEHGVRGAMNRKESVP